MKLLDTIVLSVLLVSVSAAPFQAVKRQTTADGLTLAQIDALTPPFGHDADVNPTGTGDCDGAVDDANGNPIKVPCDCPPPRDSFIQELADNINAGVVVNNPTVPISFPTDNSTASIDARFNAAAVTLQNLRGAGVGCPIAATTWVAQQQAIDAAAAGSTVAAAPPATSPAAPPSSSPVAPPSSSPVAPPSSSPVAPPTTVAPTTVAPTSAAPSDTASAPAESSTAIVVDGLTLAQIDALTPPFGHDADVNPTGTGDCDGAVDDASGNPIKVPCDCPPPRDQFIQDLANNLIAGKVVNNPTVPISFPTDNSTDSINARFNAAAVTLQNLNGPGVGCPIAATTWVAQQAAIDNAATGGQVAVVQTTAPAAAAPASSTAAAATPSITPAAGLSIAQIDALAPQLGFQAGVNPTGTGDCDGAVDGADGKPIKVPCTCPPSRDVFIQALASDIAAGHAVHNPSVSVSFPTDDSTQSQITRIQAALVALQNLNGEGVGCPAASTTLSAQLKALTG